MPSMKDNTENICSKPVMLLSMIYNPITSSHAMQDANDFLSMFVVFHNTLQAFEKPSADRMSAVIEY